VAVVVVYIVVVVVVVPAVLLRAVYDCCGQRHWKPPY
jgi:hypothetical protein